MTEDQEMRQAFDEEWERAKEAFLLLGADPADLEAHRFTAKTFFEAGWRQRTEPVVDGGPPRAEKPITPDKVTRGI